MATSCNIMMEFPGITSEKVEIRRLVIILVLVDIPCGERGSGKLCGKGDQAIFAGAR